MNTENLGPAERIIQMLLAYSDHAFHGRPGMIMSDPSSVIGVKWTPASWKEENGVKTVYLLNKVGKKTVRVPCGTLHADGMVYNGGRQIGEFRGAGLFNQAAKWAYSNVAEIYKLDNEFVARWASYAFGQEHRDLKVILAAFMLVQNRKGDPVLDNGTVAFHDEDYRNVGEAMMLLQDKVGKKDLNPKLLMRIHDILSLPEIAQINRDLGFGKSATKPFLGRWTKATEKWLRYREENPRMLEGLVKAGFRTTVMDLARAVGYKPTTPAFFETLRWKQKQAKDGRRTLAIGQEVKAAESWAGLSEQQICERIVAQKMNFKRIVGLLPKNGMTRAVMAAAIESGCLSTADMVILTPTLEEMGLLQVNEIRMKWESAVKASENMRSTNIARNVKSKELREKLQEGADAAVQKAVEEVTKNIRVYFMVDISGSMQHSIEAAKRYVAQFLQAFDPSRVHVSVFNTVGRELKIPAASKVGVEAAFRGINAGGGTNHSGGLQALTHHKPAADEDVLFIWVGDEGQHGTAYDAIVASGLRPMAFGLLRVAGENGSFVRDTAARLQIPCFMIDERTFADPYSIPRTIRQLVQSTPVGQTSIGTPKRSSLVELISRQELLQKPLWA